MKKTIKIIDLLNKIANGEEVPKKFKYNDKIYTALKKEDFTVYRDDSGNGIKKMFGIFYLEARLNDEVEIIEEDKKIEKIGSLLYCETTVESILHRKIDEIIDAINELKKDK